MDPIRASGISSGIDTESLIQKLMGVESINLQRLQARKTNTSNLQSAYATLGTKLTALRTKVDALNKASTFDAKSATSSDPTVLTASATSSAISGTYKILSITQRSTNTRINGNMPVSNGTALNLSKKLNDPTNNLGTAIVGSDADPNVGQFTITNGTNPAVTIDYNKTNDSLADVISRINNSAANVTALYDFNADRFVVTNKSSGPVNIVIQDPATKGNLAAAFKVNVAATLGQQAKVTIDGLNNNNPISSNDDIFTEAETGLPGLTFTLLKDSGAADITVKADTAGVQKQVEDLVTAYNDVIDYITKNSAVTGPDNNKQVGIFTGDLSVQSLSRELRSILSTRNPDLPNTINYLGALGVGTVDRSPKISLNDVSKLTKALTDNPASVKTLLTDPDEGILTKLEGYLDNQTKEQFGIVKTKAESTTRQLTNLSKSIDREKRRLAAYETQLRASFTAMERVISANGAGLSQILSGLNQK